MGKIFLVPFIRHFKLINSFLFYSSLFMFFMWVCLCRRSKHSGYDQIYLRSVIGKCFMLPTWNALHKSVLVIKMLSVELQYHHALLNLRDTAVWLIKSMIAEVLVLSMLKFSDGRQICEDLFFFYIGSLNYSNSLNQQNLLPKNHISLNL